MKKSVLSMLLALVMVLGFALMTAPEASAAETIELLYDDRKDLSELIGTEATTVEITNQVVTSKKIGTETADDNVLTYVDGKIIAVGTGTATIVADGTSYDVTVSAAPISMFLITGHSVGAGQEGNGAQSVVVEAGQVYSSFQRVSMPNAEGGLGYGSAVRAGGTGTGALDAFAPGQGGIRGVGSALGYRWNQLTGEKVWVMNLAIPGSCINEWLPNVAGWHYEKYKDDPAKAPTYLANYAYKYESVVERFGYAQTVMQNEIAAGHYTLSHMAMFYFSGANFTNAHYEDWTYASLKSDYETFWNGLKKDLARDMDGDGDTETFESLGIVPLWTASNTDYRQDKAINYIMAASSDYPDIYIASDVYRDWVKAAGLSTFPAIDYTTQSTAVTVPTSVSYSADTPNSVFCVSDNTHLSQVTYNAVGLDMAKVYYNVTQGNDAVTGITLQNVDGSAVGESITINCGTPGSVIVPALTPEYAKNITVTCSEGLEIVWPLAVRGTTPGTGTVTFSSGNATTTLHVEVLDKHPHCACGGHASGMENHTCEEIEYIAWGDTDAEKTTLPTATGNYYLVSDLTVGAVHTVADGSTVNLCLNGHDVTMSGKRFYSLRGVLSITDCCAEDQWGTIYSSYSSNYGGLFYTYEANDVLNLYAGNLNIDGTFVYGGVLYNTSGTVNIYKANLDGCTVARKDLTSINQKVRDGRGGVICSNSGTVNIYGGTITGGKAQNNGGNIYISSGTMNIYGGLISGGKADASLGTLTDGAAAAGGNIAIETGTVNIYEGTVTSGTSSANGGNITLTTSGAKLNISGGTVTGGVAGGHGGNVYQISGTTVTMTDGTVSGGTAVAAASKQGGNINSGAGTLNISGGTVTGGKATGYGGNICATPGGTINISGTAVISNGKTGSVSSGGTDGTTGTGGNINVGANSTNPAKLTITGGTISGGFAKQGGNIHVDGKAVISGGTIKDGTTITTGSAYTGGNINTTGRGVLEISGGTVSGGKSYNGGSIYCQYNTTISGGTISGGTATNGGGIYVTKTLTVSGGTISGGKATNGGCVYVTGTLDVTDGTISGGSANLGGNIYVDGTATVSGGTVSGGRAYRMGGNIYQAANSASTLTVTGTAVIKDGFARYKDTGTDTTDYPADGTYLKDANGENVLDSAGNKIPLNTLGGNIAIDGAANNLGHAVISGGTVSGGTANCGGNVYCAGTLEISDGTITKGTTKGNNACGGNIYQTPVPVNKIPTSQITMTGGVISEGYSNGTGGNMQIHGNFLMTGGELRNGSAASGGNVRVFRPGTFTLDGGTVTGGTSRNISLNGGTGGNVFQVVGHNPTTSYPQVATLNIKSGTVKGSTSNAVNGAVVCISQYGIVNMEGGTVIGGTAQDRYYNNKDYPGRGGVFSLYATTYTANDVTTDRPAQLNISGGVIENGTADSFGGIIAATASAGTVDINISGGTFSGGKAIKGGIIWSEDDCDIDITGGTFSGGEATEGGLFWLDGGTKLHISDGTFSGGQATAKAGLFWIGNADVTISGGSFESGTAPVADGICVTDGKLTLDGEPVFNAQLYVENPDSVILADTLNATIPVHAPYVGKIATAATDKTGCLTSKTLSLTYNAEDQGIYANGLLQAQDGSTFASFADALASGDHAIFTLLSDHEGDAEIQGKVWLNLNGFTLTGDLTGEGTLYGYDTATDDYDLSNMGRLTGSVSCQVAPHFLGTGADIVLENRYMAIPDETGYTFQRFDVKISHMSIKPGTEGVGYKATVYGGDAVLANIASVGYSLQLEDYLPWSAENAFDPAKTVVTLRIDGYGIEEHGQTPLAATARLILKDGTVIESKTVSRSFRDMVEAVNNVLDDLTNPQIAAIRALCDKYETAMQDWSVSDITGWVDPRIPTAEQMEGIDPANIYYVGPTREYTSVTKLFMDLEDDTNEKIIFLDEGTYDIFQEYKDLGVTTPPDDVTSPNYFPYCVFLPYNTRLIGLGDVLLDFSPEADEITYGESRTWSPLNIIAPCYIENIEIYCKNGRYAIHDDSHNAANDQGSKHIYKNVRCIYEMSDKNSAGQQLGFNNTIGNGMAQGTEFLFEDCYFEFRGSNSHSAFYTHESGSKNPTYVPTLTFRRCEFWGGEGNERTVRLQNLATADLQIPTVFEDCVIEGGLYLTIYKEESAQHFDVTLIRSGNPPVKIDNPDENRYPVKVEE